MPTSPPSTAPATRSGLPQQVARISDPHLLRGADQRFALHPAHPARLAVVLSVFPYVLGSSYYGVVETANFPVMMPGGNSTSVVINEPVTVYSAPVGLAEPAAGAKLTVFPSPTHDVLVVQTTVAAPTAQFVELLDLTGRVVARQILNPGSTMCYFDTQALHAGTYVVRIGGANPVRVVVE